MLANSFVRILVEDDANCRFALQRAQNICSVKFLALPHCQPSLMDLLNNSGNKAFLGVVLKTLRFWVLRKGSLALCRVRTVRQAARTAAMPLDTQSLK